MPSWGCHLDRNPWKIHAPKEIFYLYTLPVKNVLKIIDIAKQILQFLDFTRQPIFKVFFNQFYVHELKQ